MCPSDSPANGVLVYAMVQITDNESTVTCFFCELILVPVIISTVLINGFVLPTVYHYTSSTIHRLSQQPVGLST